MNEKNIKKRIKKGRTLVRIELQVRDFKLDDIRNEISDFFYKTRERFIDSKDYKEDYSDFGKNAAQAAVGTVATFVASSINPFLGLLVSLSYTEIKSYQTYKSSKNSGGGYYGHWKWFYCWKIKK